ncbi:MAG: hypothetical protein V1793_01180 [Pseudomonadota bacterium]
MISLKDLKKGIENIGLKNYILVSANGTVAAHDPLGMETHAAFVANCGRSCSDFGASRIGYMVFARTDGPDMVVFPAGRHWLGVFSPKEDNLLSLLGQVLSITGKGNAPDSQKRSITESDSG